MKAYLQGVRDYNDALKDGRIAGPNAEEIIDAIARYSVTKDRDLIRTVIPAALHPDGEVVPGERRAPLRWALRTGAPS